MSWLAFTLPCMLLLLNISLGRKILLCNLSKNLVCSICNDPIDQASYEVSSITALGGDYDVEMPDNPYACLACLVKVFDTTLHKPVVKLLCLHDSLGHSLESLCIDTAGLLPVNKDQNQQPTLRKSWEEISDQLVWPEGNNSPCVADFFTNLNLFLNSSHVSNNAFHPGYVIIYNEIGCKLTGFCANSDQMHRVTEFVIGSVYVLQILFLPTVVYACQFQFAIPNQGITVDMTIYVYAQYEISVGPLHAVKFTEKGLYYSMASTNALSRHGLHDVLELEWKQQQTGVYPPANELTTHAAKELLQRIFAHNNKRPAIASSHGSSDQEHDSPLPQVGSPHYRQNDNPSLDSISEQEQQVLDEQQNDTSSIDDVSKAQEEHNSGSNPQQNDFLPPPLPVVNAPVTQQHVVNEQTENPSVKDVAKVEEAHHSDSNNHRTNFPPHPLDVATVREPLQQHDFHSILQQYQLELKMQTQLGQMRLELQKVQDNEFQWHTQLLQLRRQIIRGNNIEKNHERIACIFQTLDTEMQALEEKFEELSIGNALGDAPSKEHSKEKISIQRQQLELSSKIQQLHQEIRVVRQEQVALWRQQMDLDKQGTINEALSSESFSPFHSGHQFPKASNRITSQGYSTTSGSSVCSSHLRLSDQQKLELLFGQSENQSLYEAKNSPPSLGTFQTHNILEQKCALLFGPTKNQASHEAKRSRPSYFNPLQSRNFLGDFLRGRENSESWQAKKQTSGNMTNPEERF